MSRFPDALRSALAEMKWSASEIARRSKAVSQPSVGRYLAGIDLPKPGTLDQLCSPFPAHIQEELTAAYLSEHIPFSIRERVHVTIAKVGTQNAEPFALDRPTPGSHGDWVISTLSRAMMTDPNLALVLDYLASGIEGRPPMSDQTGEDLAVRTLEEQTRIDEAEREISALESGKKPPRKIRYTSPKRRDHQTD